MAAEVTITFKANNEIRKIKLDTTAANLLFGAATPDPQVAEAARAKYREEIEREASVLRKTVLSNWISDHVTDV